MRPGTKRFEYVFLLEALPGRQYNGLLLNTESDNRGVRQAGQDCMWLTGWWEASLIIIPTCHASRVLFIPRCLLYFYGKDNTATAVRSGLNHTQSQSPLVEQDSILLFSSNCYSSCRRDLASQITHYLSSLTSAEDKYHQSLKIFLSTGVLIGVRQVRSRDSRLVDVFIISGNVNTFLSLVFSHWKCWKMRLHTLVGCCLSVLNTELSLVGFSRRSGHWALIGGWMPLMLIDKTS